MFRQEITSKYLINLSNNVQGKAVNDLKLNFEKFADSEFLSDDEYALLLISLGRTLSNQSLEMIGLEIANHQKITDEIINEAKQIPAIMGMLNTYYKFRFFVEKNDGNAAQEYGSPLLRMNALAKPYMTKELYELISLAISILNSCEKCVIAHEKAVMNLNITRAKINDVLRITSVAKGLSLL
ncbi:carboxymuconolactone decarboxylase family protein [Fluviispira sanaruensis]|uniref:Carboxymuconolactone decarboxylase family protein n=1 Tax=Fluviispira sanaruensis TaxID=2493639 RepID=A0A4P2VI41_FLUSA|nr:carboxymuconolactone decarboxylase family protein [Fluviispira sanaruensis]BBH52733.1 carboxymuconolactone decarboxylase family protein [Fluviispira sanaruensis]